MLVPNIGHSFLAAGLLASSAFADVWVVDQASGPGADFGDIQLAVNAASDGDTIVVKDGSYQMFAVDGKSLSIVADGDSVLANGGSIFYSVSAMEIRNLTADQEVVLRGLQTDTGIGIRNCDGAVWLDDLYVTGDVPCSSGGTTGAYIENSHKVTITNSELHGETNSDPWHQHLIADGVWAVSSTVQFYDCVIEGGWGEDDNTPLPGGAGLRIDDSTVTVVGCTIAGGPGGVDPGNTFQGTTLCTGSHAIGGAGILFENGTGVLYSGESTAVGGVASLEPLCPGQTGPPGPAISGIGTIVPLVGFARHLQANSPVRGGEQLTFDVEGQAGELPLLLVSLAHEPLPLYAHSGVLLVAFPLSDVFVLPILPAGGQASLSFPVPNVGSLVGAVSYRIQAVFVDAASSIWLGAGTTTVLLDSSF